MAAEGRISQIKSVVIDVLFEDGHLPEIMNALELTRDDGSKIVLEAAQHLGESTIRAVAMDSTDGLQRGHKVVDTGRPISVPVGENILGRMFDHVGTIFGPILDRLWIKFGPSFRISTRGRKYLPSIYKCPKNRNT